VRGKPLQAAALFIAVFVIAMPLAWLALVPLTRQLDGAWADAVRYTATAVLTLLLMRLVWKRAVFSFCCPSFARNLFTCGLLGLIGAAGAFFFSYETVDTAPGAGAVCGVLTMNLAVAVSEEFLFRGVALNVLLRAYSAVKNPVYKAVTVSSVLFGLRHLLNLAFTPGAVTAAAAQVVFTMMAGTWLCAVYLRSKNIWVCALIHFLEDLAVSVWPLFSTQAAASASADIQISEALRMVFLQAPYLLFAWLMLRDEGWRASLMREYGA